MNVKYTAWIEQHVQEYRDAYGHCAEVSLKMAETFPELRRVRGHYFCPIWDRRAHWWLVTEDGEVVDPTALQFPSMGTGLYEEWDDSQPQPTGICVNCGEERFTESEFCSDECRASYITYLNTGVL